MKKLQIDVKPESWGDLNTKYPPESPFVAVNEFTEGSVNIDTSRKGVLTKRPGSITYSTLPGTPMDQYEAIFSDGVRHLLTVDGGVLRYSPGDGNENVALTGLTSSANCEFATTQDRVYFGNGAQKKVYDRVTTYGGVTYTFPTQTIKDMGCQPPQTGPTSGTPTAGGSIPDGTYTYKVTYLYYDYEESNGSAASVSQTCSSGNNTIPLTNIPIGGYGVTARKIYRADSITGLYYLVGILNNNTVTTFTDTSSTVSTPLPTDNNLPPNFTLVTLYLDKLFLAGVSGDPYTLYYSETGYPDVFLSENTLSCNEEDPITGMVVYLDRLVVFNRKSMGQVLGKTSDQFRYAAIEGSVGCVDNRSVQVRVINGVPTLIWLSDKGFYGYDGNSIVYLSDKIENLVDVEIQQANIQKGRNAQSTYSAFTSGVKSNGINLEVNPGTITNKGPFWDTSIYPLASYEDQTNPQVVYNTRTDWEGGTELINTCTKNTGSDLNTVTSPLAKTYALANGTLNGAIISGSNLTLTQASDFTGLGDAGGYVYSDDWNLGSILADQIYIKRAGTITGFQILFSFGAVNTNGMDITPKIYSTSGNLPGSVLWTGATVHYSYPPASYYVLDVPVNLHVGDNTKVFLAIEASSPWSPISIHRYCPHVNGNFALFLYFYNNTGSFPRNLNYQSPNGWVNPTDPYTIDHYHFIQDAVPASGGWTSEIYDSYLYSNTNDLTVNLAHVATYPSGTTVSTTLQQSDNSDMSSPTEITVSSYNGTQAFTFNDTKRYWRTKLNLTTTDDRTVPTVQAPTLQFPITSEWVSQPIDCTADVTLYDSATITSIVPSGTSATLTAASSDDNITYTSYMNIGSLPLKRYVKFKITLTSNSNGTAVAKVSNLLFNWTVTANLKGVVIDTAVTPAGWDVFQAEYVPNGGVVSFYMRSGPNLVDEGGVNVPGTSPSTVATWHQVYSGEFPTVSLPVQRYVQWKVVLESKTFKVPEVNSLTVNWFINTIANPIRCASIFFNKNYYLAASEFGQTSNNLLFMFDFKGKWRVLKGINAATFSYFFNNPYFGDAITNKVCKFWEQTSDSGAAIEFDFRSRAFDFSSEYSDNEEKIKILDHVLFFGNNTGATYSCFYSLDDGETFLPLYTTDGLTTWTTATDGKKFVKFLRPNYQTTIGNGRTIMFRAYNNDTYEVELDGFKMTAFVRTQPPIITG